MTRPYVPPKALSPDLLRVKAYWESLLRGSAEVPFWDDLDLTTLHDIAGRLFLVGVFSKPERFRLDLVGEDLTAAAGGQVAGLFTDEVGASPPFDFLASQCSAAVPSGRPGGWPDLSSPPPAHVGRRPAQHAAGRHRLEPGLTRDAA